MFLYTPEAVAQLGVSSGGMESFLVEGVVTSNEATATSEDGTRLAIAYMGPVRQLMNSDVSRQAVQSGSLL